MVRGFRGRGGWRHRTGPGTGTERGPWWHGRFRGAGYRMTVPRQEILRTLTGARSHMSAEEIYLTVRKSYPAVGLTTVYRTLELLVEMGVLRKFDFGDGRARYELSAGPGGEKHHHHLICSNCGKVIDYTDFIDEERELIEKTQKALSKKYGFKINTHDIHFYGLCDKCKGGV